VSASRPANPFPRKRPDGIVVVDETCACGHRRSGHADSTARGHGRCEVEHSMNERKRGRTVSTKTRIDRLRARRTRAWHNWLLLRATPIGARAWRWVMAWDAAYHAELRGARR
jgi:hypothetical protein